MPESIRAERTAIWGNANGSSARTEAKAREAMPTPIALTIVTDAPPSSAPTRNAMADTVPMTTQDPPLPEIPPPPKPSERASLPSIPPRAQRTRAWEHDPLRSGEVRPLPPRPGDILPSLPRPRAVEATPVSAPASLVTSRDVWEVPPRPAMVSTVQTWEPAQADASGDFPTRVSEAAPAIAAAEAEAADITAIAPAPVEPPPASGPRVSETAKPADSAPALDLLTNKAVTPTVIGLGTTEPKAPIPPLPPVFGVRPLSEEPAPGTTASDTDRSEPPRAATMLSQSPVRPLSENAMPVVHSVTRAATPTVASPTDHVGEIARAAAAGSNASLQAAVQALTLAAAAGWTAPTERGILSSPRAQKIYVAATTVALVIMAGVIVFLATNRVPAAYAAQPPPRAAEPPPVVAAPPAPEPPPAVTATATVAAPAPTQAPAPRSVRQPRPAPVAAPVPTPIRTTGSTSSTSSKKLDDASRSAELLRQQLGSAAN